MTHSPRNCQVEFFSICKESQLCSGQSNMVPLLHIISCLCMLPINHSCNLCWLDKHLNLFSSSIPCLYKLLNKHAVTLCNCSRVNCSVRKILNVIFCDASALSTDPQTIPIRFSSWATSKNNSEIEKSSVANLSAIFWISYFKDN